MSQPAILMENLGKQYRLGVFDHRSLRRDLESWWARLRGCEDPNAVIDVKGGRHSLRRGQRFWALREVNLEIPQGEALGIIGPNGAGKTTLLKILSRITAPTVGRVHLWGRVGSLLEVGTGFHPELTGRENVYFNGAILGMTRREISRRFDEIVEFSGLAPFIDTPVKRYSSGMQVRLGFAVAAHLDAEILLVDEVLAVGDVAFQKKCLGKMGQVARQGRTVLFVSHNMRSMLNLVQRCLLLEEGRIAALGETKEVVDRYLGRQLVGGGQMSFPPDPRKVAQITAARLRNSRGEVTSTFSPREEIQVEVEFRVYREGLTNLGVGFCIGLPDHITLWCFFRGETSLDPVRFAPGRHRLLVVVPGGHLNSGRYVLRPSTNWFGKAHHNHPTTGLGIDFEISGEDQDDLLGHKYGNKPGLMAIKPLHHELTTLDPEPEGGDAV